MCAQIVRDSDQDGSPRGAVPARALPYPNPNLDRFPRMLSAFLCLSPGRRGGLHLPSFKSRRRSLAQDAPARPTSRGLMRRCGRLTSDEENRAFRPLEEFRRNLTEKKLVARPRAYTHYQEIVTTHIELTENGFLRRADAAHRGSHLDPIMIAQPDDLADDGVGAGRWCKCGADVASPRARSSLPTSHVERGHGPMRCLCQRDR